MPTPAQAGAAVATAGVLSAGSYGIYHYTTSEQKPKDPTEPTEGLVTFTSSEDLSAYNTGTIKLLKSSNLPYVVKGNDVKNKSWWEWKFEKAYNNPSNVNKKTGAFADIKAGYADQAGDTKGLNKACEEAYGNPSSGFSAYKANAEAISAFCTKNSTDVSEPKAASYENIQVVTTAYPNGVLTVEKNQTKLAKTNSDNQIWWEWVFNKRVKGNNTQDSDAFKHIANGYDANPKTVTGQANVNQTALNQACDSAYRKTKPELTTEQNKLLNEIKKYCSIVENDEIALPGEPVLPAQKPTENITKLSNTDTTSSGSYVGKLVSLLTEENLGKLIKPVADDNTQKWWKWAYENKFKKHTSTTDIDEIFSKVEEGYAASAKTGETEKQVALNQACHKAYEQLEAKYEFGAGKHLLNNIGEFCNSADEKEDISEPKSATYTSAVTNYENGVLSIEGNRAHLVKTTQEGTNKVELWWKWSFNKNFNSGSKTTLYHTLFQQVTNHYGTNTTTDLNKACDEAYKKAYSEFKESNSKLLSSISSLCTKGLKAQPIDKPEPTTTGIVLDTSTTYSSGDLMSETNKTHNKDNLVDPNKGDDWWNWSYETRVAKYTDKSKIPSIFASVKKGHDTSEKGTTGNKEALKFACKEAYGKDKTALKEITGTKKLVDFVKEFCAIKSTTSLKYTEN